MVSRRLSKNYRKRRLSKNYKKVGKSRKVSKNIRRKQHNRRKSYKGGSNQNINVMTTERLQLATTLSQFPQMKPSTLVSLGYSMEDIAAATQFNENMKKK